MLERNNPSPDGLEPDVTKISLTILGSGTCVPSLDRSSCALLVELQYSKLLFDIGAGTIRRLLESKTEIAQVSHILVSHFHPDHTGELASFLFSSKYASTGARIAPLTLIGGRGLHVFLQSLSTAYRHWIELKPDLINIIELDTIDKDAWTFKDFSVTSLPVNHNDESIAYRIESSTGKTIVYSGDTDYCDTLVEIAKDADVFVCECSFPDPMKVSGHLTPSLAGEIASKANVSQLVLTHFYPQCDMTDIEKQCRKTYKGSLFLARDLLKIHV